MNYIIKRQIKLLVEVSRAWKVTEIALTWYQENREERLQGKC